MRKLKITAVLIAMLTFGTTAGFAHAAPAPVVGAIKAGQGIFWKGAKVGGLTDRIASLPGTTSADCMEAGPCFSYGIRLTQPGARLRVAIDSPGRRDMYKLSVLDPDGNTAASTENINAFNAEVFVDKPAKGLWTVVVAPQTAEYSTFGLRAKLERTLYTPRKASMWAPNLIVPRLWEFGFVAPVTGIAGFSFDDANPPLSAAGVAPFSCTFDETAEGAHRCLRFSFQLSNAGPGNFDVRFNTTGHPKEGKMVQCIERPRKPLLAHDAGEFWFHEVHGHYHYQDVVEHQLYKVTNRHTGEMHKVGRGEKVGYHPADQSFAEWDKFVQAESGTSTSAGNCYEGSNDQLGLSKGWGDAYRWQRPGNFVEFGDNPDGYYVIRTVADPLNHVIESNESDNNGYAYVYVRGNSAQLMENGRGTSPWDSHKIVSRY